MQILKIKKKRPGFGVPRVTQMLRREGLKVNHKKVERICKALGLMIKKKRKKYVRVVPGLKDLPIAIAPNKLWAIDFVTDNFSNSRKYRSLTIVDVYSRRSPGIYVNEKMSNGNFLSQFEELKKNKDLPEVIMVDSGTEFTSHLFRNWCEQNKIMIYYIDKGCPTQNAYIESFNGRFRDECLNRYSFNSLAHARKVIEIWRKDYNFQRPHSSLDYKTPIEYEREYRLHFQ